MTSVAGPHSEGIAGSLDVSPTDGHRRGHIARPIATCSTWNSSEQTSVLELADDHRDSAQDNQLSDYPRDMGPPVIHRHLNESSLKLPQLDVSDGEIGLLEPEPDIE